MFGMCWLTGFVVVIVCVALRCFGATLYGLVLGLVAGFGG